VIPFWYSWRPFCDSFSASSSLLQLAFFIELLHGVCLCTGYLRVFVVMIFMADSGDDVLLMFLNTP
jgi:hypothetical protein